MRSLVVSSTWSVVRCYFILGAIAFAWLMTAQACPAQEAPAPGQEKKPAAPPAKSDDSGKGGRAGMMSQMKGARGGMGMMGQMGGGMEMMMGQPGKPAQAAEPTLEEMLNKALKDNPDIRVAEAKVREAEAELNRTRLQVTQKVLAFHHSRESQKAIVKVSEEDLQRVARLNASKAIAQEELRLAQQRLSAAKAKLAEVEAEMPYLLGQQHELNVQFSTPSATFGTRWAEINPQIEPTWEIGLRDTSHAAWFGPLGTKIGAPQEAKSIADKVRKALDTQVTVDYRQKPLGEILDDLKKKAPGLSIHDLSGFSGQVLDLKIDGQVPLRTALELLEDTCSVLHKQVFEGGAVSTVRVSFVLRDYGLLFAPNDSLPPGAVRISNLGTAVQVTKPKEKPAEKSEEKGQSEKKH